MVWVVWSKSITDLQTDPHLKYAENKYPECHELYVYMYLYTTMARFAQCETALMLEPHITDWPTFDIVAFELFSSGDMLCSLYTDHAVLRNCQMS